MSTYFSQCMGVFTGGGEVRGTLAHFISPFPGVHLTKSQCRFLSHIKYLQQDPMICSSSGLVEHHLLALLYTGLFHPYY